MTAARTLAAFAALLLAGAALAALLMPTPPAHADTRPPAVVNLNASLGSTANVGDPLLTAAAPGAELSPAQAAEVHATADRICEGLTAGVPVTTMETAVAADTGLPLPQAHAFVAAALTACAAL